MKKEEILDKLREIKPVLEQNYGISEIGLFGSYLRGDYTPESDIDILVEYSRVISLFKVVEIIEYLQDIFNKNIDLVSKEDLKKILKSRILNEVVYV
ncbi:MAG: nucleotidyltransferase family protein [Heliobacteriaceae bacterium]|jgi:predicted nucleotidyltransferase|nr:nucleotidyltransferase family protein [Heliobacteriaceae bacterium]